MKVSKVILIILSGLFLLFLASCSSAAASMELNSSPTVIPVKSDLSSTLASSPTRLIQDAPKSTQVTAEPEPTTSTSPVAPSSTQCLPDQCASVGSFPFNRPIVKPGNELIDGSYRFGSTQSGKRDPHHGVEFLNSFGTPVHAAADGQVVVAGDDRQTIYGPYYYFYGNLVVLEHSLPAYNQPIYTLYAHLSEILVKEGQQVLAGEEIGLVGMTGVATGSHLHFEVRFGENSYQASRNPELWLQPLNSGGDQTGGAIAGRILSNPWINLNISSIVVERLPDRPDQASTPIYLGIYEEKGLRGLEPWGESFAISDLQPGEYRISFVQYGIQQQEIDVLPGKVTLITFDLTGEE